jgi:hypothetical protein
METELRYTFGKNWEDYVANYFNDARLEASRDHILAFLKLPTLENKSFIDIGCGSGLHSLAAFKAGAIRIHSFDYDEDSIRTTRKLREMVGNPAHWRVERGSVLDADYVQRLEPADIVYSWGVLHHTGQMWSAVKNATIPMRSNGVLYIALYTSDIFVERSPQYWLDIKQRYNHVGPVGKKLMELQYCWNNTVWPNLKGLRNPFPFLARKNARRGMNYWIDVKDWLGGWPMEFASITETKQYCTSLGLELVNINAGEANTEYLFRRNGEVNYWDSIRASWTIEKLQSPFIHRGGKAYTSALNGHSDTADEAEGSRRSRLMMFENGTPIGFAHQRVKDIARFGGGRYRHLRNELVFSTTDASDPNTNGREYTICATSLR